MVALSLGVTVVGALIGSLDSLNDLHWRIAAQNFAAGWHLLPEPVRRLAAPSFFGAIAIVGFLGTGVSLVRRPPAVRLPEMRLSGLRLSSVRLLDMRFADVGLRLLRLPGVWFPELRLPHLRQPNVNVARTPSPARQTPRSSRATGRNASRTPKAVQALADSGSDSAEIARRTGLPVDAVAMLLSIGSGGRQLRPPTA